MSSSRFKVDKKKNNGYALFSAMVRFNVSHRKQ